MENARLDANATATAKVAGPAVDMKKAKTDFDLHVLLIEKTEALAKGKAVVKAYTEGPEGLQARLRK